MKWSPSAIVAAASHKRGNALTHEAQVLVAATAARSLLTGRLPAHAAHATTERRRPQLALPVRAPAPALLGFNLFARDERVWCTVAVLAPHECNQVNLCRLAPPDRNVVSTTASAAQHQMPGIPFVMRGNLID